MAPPALIERAWSFADRVALRDQRGEHTFANLLAVSEGRARALRREHDDLEGERIGYLVAPGFDHVTTQWAIWRAGGVAVPLAVTYPAPELARMIDDARPVLLVADESLCARAEEAAELAARIGAERAEGIDERMPGRPDEPTPGGSRVVEVVTPAQLDAAVVGTSIPLPTLAPSRPALMVYTSGTTGRPKGVVSTHATVEAQITTLVDAWEWSPEDRIVHVLPLHHVHGIINALCCAQWSGACCDFYAAHDAPGTWDRLSGGEVTLFMAVPTMYRRLIDTWEEADEGQQERWSTGARHLRLMVSGSAALPVETIERWEAITGQQLLERYGMTEIGMALGNPLRGERRAGTVGRPFAGVETRLIGEGGAPAAPGEQGEIEVRGPQVFSEYWGLPDETGAAFSADGWFRTGDEAIVDDGYWRIVGRRGVDIIKTGGYKVSALEIEACMRAHADVADVAVVGVDDPEWGERVCAAVLPEPGAEVAAEEVRAWCKEQLAPYKVPKQLVFVDELPRNAMGKVLKPELRRVFTDAAP
jgi:malonyl-CoA/methylmalonyl-CoA synthetase